MKKLEEERQQLQKGSFQSIEDPNFKTAEEVELAAVEADLLAERVRLGTCEGELTALMDLNCERLSD